MPRLHPSSCNSKEKPFIYTAASVSLFDGNLARIEIVNRH
ncbi:hypothetical protein PT974_03922 [Cladobotryum mycophilum]|uniref:Uncharacterized protein n=1 Tax=Cladobotryum mycophilum TaxID=491253 RepID=A0ABR0STM9_9HYPO